MPGAEPQPRPISVLVGDAQLLFAESLAAGLAGSSEIEVVASFPTTGGDVVEAAMAATPEVVLVDFWIPGMKGTAVADALAAWSQPTEVGPKVLLLSWLHGKNQIQEALASAAVGFLPKSLSLAQVTQAVRQAHSGDPLVYGPQLAALVDNIEARHLTAQRRTAMLASLSAREVQILQALSCGGSRHVVATELSISTGTLKNHIHKILAKTESTDVLQVVALARYLGVIKEVGPPDGGRG